MHFFIFPKASNDESEEVFQTLEKLFNGVKPNDLSEGPGNNNLSKGTFAALKGKHRQAINFWKAEIASSKAGSETRIKTVRSMLYSTLELTGNLDEVAGLVDFVATIADDVVLVDLEKCLVDIFRQFLISDSAIFPASHTGSVVTSPTGNADTLGNHVFIRKSDLKPSDHFLLLPETFIKIFVTRKQVLWQQILISFIPQELQ